MQSSTIRSAFCLILWCAVTAGCSIKNNDDQSAFPVFRAEDNDRLLSQGEFVDLGVLLADQGASFSTLNALAQLGTPLTQKVGNDFCRLAALTPNPQTAGTAYRLLLEKQPQTAGHPDVVFNLGVIAIAASGYMCLSTLAS